jgi:hypothetical protein
MGSLTHFRLRKCNCQRELAVRSGIDTTLLRQSFRLLFRLPYPAFACESSTANVSWLCVRGLIHVVLNNGNEILVLVPYPTFACESSTANVSWLCAQNPFGIQLGFLAKAAVAWMEAVPYPAFLYESNLSITKIKKDYPECLLRHFRQSFFCYRNLLKSVSGGRCLLFLFGYDLRTVKFGVIGVIIFRVHFVLCDTEGRPRFYCFKRFFFRI